MPSISLVSPTLSPAPFFPSLLFSFSFYLFLRLLLPSLVLLCGLYLLQEAQVVTVTAQAHVPLAFTPAAGPGDTHGRQRSCHCPGYWLSVCPQLTHLTFPHLSLSLSLLTDPAPISPCEHLAPNSTLAFVPATSISCCLSFRAQAPVGFLSG